jgi:hypothetical protein
LRITVLMTRSIGPPGPAGSTGAYVTVWPAGSTPSESAECVWSCVT